MAEAYRSIGVTRTGRTLHANVRRYDNGKTRS